MEALQLFHAAGPNAPPPSAEDDENANPRQVVSIPAPTPP